MGTKPNGTDRMMARDAVKICNERQLCNWIEKGLLRAWRDAGEMVFSRRQFQQCVQRAMSAQ